MYYENNGKWILETSLTHARIIAFDTFDGMLAFAINHGMILTVDDYENNPGTIE